MDGMAVPVLWKELWLMERIFVYGTLMRGMTNHCLIQDAAKDTCEAFVFGKLVHLRREGYPMLFKGNDRVTGELIVLSDVQKTLQTMDILEEFYGSGNPRNLYERVIIKVESAGNFCDAWVYICPEAIEKDMWRRGLYLAHGNWRIYQESISMQKRKG